MSYRCALVICRPAAAAAKDTSFRYPLVTSRDKRPIKSTPLPRLPVEEISALIVSKCLFVSAALMTRICLIVTLHRSPVRLAWALLHASSRYSLIIVAVNPRLLSVSMPEFRRREVCNLSRPHAAADMSEYYLLFTLCTVEIWA